MLYKMFAALAILAALAHAQPTPPRTTPTAIVMADEPVRIQSVGLSFQVPEGTRANTDRVGERALVRVTPEGDETPWILTVDTPASRDLNLTPTAVADEVLKQILESVGVPMRKLEPGKGLQEESVETAGLLMERSDAVKIPGSRATGVRFYVKIPRGPQETPAVRGYTVFPAGSGRFVSFDLATTEPAFPLAKTIYETCIATAVFDDMDALAASRGAAVEAGISLMAALTPEDLRAIIQSRQDTWYRVYKEAPGKADMDAAELGYQRIKAWVGQRGELDPGKEKARWQNADRQQGFLVLIEGRALLDQGLGQQIVDTRATYFMTPDRGEEVWSIQMAIRDPARRNPDTWLETGARSAGNMSVNVAGSGQVSKQAQPMVPDQGYLTLVEGLLLPQILVRSGSPKEYGFYMYQSEYGNVRLRRDTLEPIPDDPGSWRLTTRMSEDKEPRVALYRATGELISSRQADGTITEPIQLDRLVDLWRRKNLPMN